MIECFDPDDYICGPLATALGVGLGVALPFICYISYPLTGGFYSQHTGCFDPSVSWVADPKWTASYTYAGSAVPSGLFLAGTVATFTCDGIGTVAGDGTTTTQTCNCIGLFFWQNTNGFNSCSHLQACLDCSCLGFYGFG